MCKYDPAPLSQQEMKDLLHYFGLTLDWSVVKMVPLSQIDQVQYPVPVFGMPEGHRRRVLKLFFGDLSPQWQAKYDEWLKTAPLQK